MASPLVKIYDRIGAFAPQYYGSVQYYATMAQYARAVVDLDLRYDKRFKSVHRCDIVDTQGLLLLTVPISKPGDKRCTNWNECTVSSHGQWWADHRVSLESAYGRTPFFEYYIDRFKPFLGDTNISITDFDKEIDKVIRGILSLDTEVEYQMPMEREVDDWRRNQFPSCDFAPYYQVRAHQLGFYPNLSILDLIFNLGPEAPVYLRGVNNE